MARRIESSAKAEKARFEYTAEVGARDRSDASVVPNMSGTCSVNIIGSPRLCAHATANEQRRSTRAPSVTAWINTGCISTHKSSVSVGTAGGGTELGAVMA